MVLGTKLDELLEFPTNIKFKVMGENVPNLLDLITNTLKELKLEIIGEPTFNTSSSDKWKSYTVEVKVENKEILEQVYIKLGEIKEVRFVI